jgi:2-amino-4-hydroxy-6-hydroxymethyldihydropteridine diphosphokinase
MARVFLGLGSNIERERYIVAGLDALARLFGEIEHSSVYDSAAIGFEGSAFLNLVVALETPLGVAALAAQLRQIEVEHGRPVNATRFSSRQLDIDILTYDDLVGAVDGVVLPRGEILENAFVLQPLAELAPQRLHPAVGKSYAQLWSGYDTAAQQLRRIDFEWQGRLISECDTNAGPPAGGFARS